MEPGGKRLRLGKGRAAPTSGHLVPDPRPAGACREPGGHEGAAAPGAVRLCPGPHPLREGLPKRGVSEDGPPREAAAHA